MSFPRYPEYKDSGVEWLGRVPGHWDVGQSRRLFALRNERALVADKQLTASQVHGVIYQEDFIRLEGRKVVEVIKGADILKHVESNDFVISMRSFQGGIEWCQVPGCISSAYVMLVPCDRIHGPFFQYLLKSQSYIQALQTTSNLVRDGQALRYDNFTQVDLPLVPLDEQTQIAAFLDRETAKIDALVAEQRRLMALLQEKRQAGISHAVTRGLNPHAPMKPSGIEWLGDVPAYWEVRRVKHLSSRISSGKTPSGGSEVYVDSGITFLRSQNVYDEGLRLDDVAFITEMVDEAMAVSRVRANDILLNITGASIGRSCVVPSELPPANVNQHVCVIRLLDPSKVPFVGWSFKSTGIKNQIDHAQNGAAREGLNFVQIGEMVLPLPPAAEQAAINSFLGLESAKFDTLTTEAQRAIDLLQERRTALISAAVTGQIDVRGVGGAHERIQ